MKYRSLGSVSVIFASLLWSVDGLLRTQLYSLPPAVVVFWEHAFGFLLVAPVLVFTFRRFKQLTKKQWLSIAIVSFLSGALGTILYTAALIHTKYIPFSVVVLLQQLQPIFAISMAAIILKEPLTKRFITLSVIAIAAAYAVAFPNLTINLATGAGTFIAAMLALGAAASWGSSTALSKYSLKNTSSLHITAARFGLTPLFALVFVAAGGSLGHLGSLSTIQWLYIVAITFSTGFVALVIYYFGLKRVPASRSAILELTWPLSALIVGYVFLHQTLTLTQLAGAGLLLAAVVMIARDAQSTEKKSDTELTALHVQEA